MWAAPVPADGMQLCPGCRMLRVLRPCVKCTVRIIHCNLRMRMTPTGLEVHQGAGHVGNSAVASVCALCHCAGGGHPGGRPQGGAGQRRGGCRAVRRPAASGASTKHERGSLLQCLPRLSRAWGVSWEAGQSRVCYHGASDPNKKSLARCCTKGVPRGAGPDQGVVPGLQDARRQAREQVWL